MFCQTNSLYITFTSTAGQTILGIARHTFKHQKQFHAMFVRFLRYVLTESTAASKQISFSSIVT